MLVTHSLGLPLLPPVLLLLLMMMITQLFEDVAVVQNGALMSLQHLGTDLLAAHHLPHQLSVSPLCVVRGGGEEEEVALTLFGKGIAGPDTAVLLKCGGQHLPVSAGADCGHMDQKGLEAVSCTFKPPQVCVCVFVGEEGGGTVTSLSIQSRRMQCLLPVCWC